MSTLDLLGAYVFVGSVRDLLLRAEPHESIAGIVLAAVSLIVMPLLASRNDARESRWAIEP